MIHRSIGELIEGQQLLALSPDTPVRAACERMRERYVGSVVVVDAAGAPVGIFTERDAVCRVLAAGLDAAAATLARVMTARPECLGPEATPLEALRLMREGGYRHVPVVRGGRAVGMVSFTDFRGLDFARLEARLDEEEDLTRRLR